MRWLLALLLLAATPVAAQPIKKWQVRVTYYPDPKTPIAAANDPGRIEISVGDRWAGCAIASVYELRPQDYRLAPLDIAWQVETSDPSRIKVQSYGELVRLQPLIKITDIGTVESQ